MAETGLPVERLRQFLRELTPEARALLMAELERTGSHGEGLPAADLILNELRDLIDPAEPVKPPPRVGNPSRLFFNFLEPFLVDDAPDRKHTGRIARTSLDPLWKWIGRDLLPNETAAFETEAAEALAANDTAGCERLTRQFQLQVAQAIEQAVSFAQDERALRRIAAHVGTPRAMDEVGEILGILKARDILTALSSRLPPQITNLGDEQLENVKMALDAVGRQKNVLPYAIVLVLSRLAQPWQLIRLAVRAAESDVAARVMETPYALAVSIVLADVERQVIRLRHDLKRAHTEQAIAYLKDIHDAARGLRTELDLSVDSPLARQLAAIRADISEILKAEIESIPGRVRRILRPRPAKEIAPRSTVDTEDVAEIEAAIVLLNACRKYASELAMNQVAISVHSDLHNYLDTGTPALLESLRNAGDSDRAFRKSQADAAVRFCSKLFGLNYATQLAKATELAANPERKAAKG